MMISPLNSCFNKNHAVNQHDTLIGCLTLSLSLYILSIFFLKNKSCSFFIFSILSCYHINVSNIFKKRRKLIYEKIL